MSNNVIDFPRISEDNSYCVTDGDIGILNMATNIELRRTGNIFVLIDEIGAVEFFDRKDLAEFLWMCACLVDSEERYRSQDEIIGADYD